MPHFAPVSMEKLLRQFDNFIWQDFPGTEFSNAALVDSGSSIGQTRLIRGATGTNANSSGKRALNYTEGVGFSRGKDMGVLNWGKRIVFTFSFGEMAGAANGISRVLLGPQRDDAVQDLNDKGIALVIDNLTMSMDVHDGSSLTSVAFATSPTAVVNTTYIVAIICDGLGNVEVFLDGVSQGTTASGPTGDSASGHCCIIVESENNASTANQSIDVHQVKLGVAQ
jgi:hypothetical protein